MSVDLAHFSLSNKTVSAPYVWWAAEHSHSDLQQFLHQIVF